MASSMVIPASKDTLFMRGFSSRQDIDDLRGFFSREGRCTVEFFKQSENKDKLYVALRFESKDIARDILNKFDNKEVLGDRITISWFKDLRRARAQGRYRVTDFNRHRWGGYYDRDQHQHYSGNRWHHSPIGSRSRRYDRSSSHSRSSSRSPSGSRSRSRSRDRHHHRSNSADSRDSGKRSHSRNGGRGRHQKSPAHDDSTDKEADQASRGRSRKLTNTSDERSPGVEKKCSKDGNHGDDDRHVICSHSSLDRVSDVDNSFEHSPPKSAKYLRSAVTTVEPPVDNNSNNKVLDTSSEQKLGYTTSYPQQQQRYQSARYFSDDSPPAEKANEAATKRRKENRYNNDFNRCYEGYERTDPDTADRASYSPDHKRGSARSQESDTIADNPESPSPLPKDGYPYKDNRSAWRPDTKSDDHSSAVQRSYRSTGDGYGRERSPPDVMDDDSWRNRKRQQSVLSDEEEEFDSQHRNIIDGEAKKKRIIDDALPTKELKRDRFDERSCSGSRTSSRGREDPGGEAKKKTAPGMLNNRFCREMEKGALGLSQDRMALVREKKDEIEKAYRQDCETFAVVVKMLVSKDTKLEDQLQFSLRENLKDIGQRCIHELREFIEQLKSEEEMQL